MSLFFYFSLTHAALQTNKHHPFLKVTSADLLSTWMTDKTERTKQQQKKNSVRKTETRANHLSEVLAQVFLEVQEASRYVQPVTAAGRKAEKKGMLSEGLNSMFFERVLRHYHPLLFLHIWLSSRNVFP